MVRSKSCSALLCHPLFFFVVVLFKNKIKNANRAELPFLLQNIAAQDVLE